MTSVWAGRWGEYFVLKKMAHEWHKKGLGMDEIEARLRRELEGVPLKAVDG